MSKVNLFSHLPFIIFLLLTFYFLLLTPAQAVEFASSHDVVYAVQEDGTTDVRFSITLTNLVTNLYATKYAVTIKNTSISHVQGTDEAGPLKIDVATVGDETTISASFNRIVVGKGATFSFTISFDAADIARRVGRIWEVSLPKVSQEENISSYKASLVVPESFGEVLYLKPEPASYQSRRFVWTYDQLKEQSVMAAFGQSQLFSFHLAYHLANLEEENVLERIALPPDTNYQRVVYTTLDPSPLGVELDKDGNWLANYQLSANQRLDIEAAGYVELFIKPRADFPLSDYDGQNQMFLNESQYWPVNHPQIKALALKLKTPLAIYRYVVDTLSYDYARVTSLPTRLGAVRSLEEPASSLCMEFTDLTVTLLRAAGIPARELNGFAYTNNSELRPLSLIADVLHAWPEYYDQEEKVWRQIDPTWEDTTQGVDYFTNLDVNHFVFAIHGSDSNFPQPAGGYKLIVDGEVEKSRDVEVVFDEAMPDISLLPVKAEIKLSPTILLTETQALVIVLNPNSQAVYNTAVKLTSDGLNLDPATFTIKALPPWGSTSLKLKTKPKKLIPWFTTSIRVDVAGNTFTHSIDGNLPRVMIALPIIIVFIGLTLLAYRKKKATGTIKPGQSD